MSDGSILVVGSVALDDIETPFGAEGDVLGGTAVYFSAAASLFGRVRLVGIVGDDYPLRQLEFLRERGVDLGGLERRDGESFRWGGRYHYDMNTRDTTYTELGVFADFAPDLPDEFRQAAWVFLGNIDPALQLRVLDQIEEPKLVACDTMNYWISGSSRALMQVLERADMVTLNDEEARELAGDPNLARAARWIRERGPSIVVIKKGEHGAMLFTDESTFFSPGYPLEDVVDPTGAGDAFAGGVLGHLARAPEPRDPMELRRAVVYGCALGSFACEAFGPGRLRDLSLPEVEERVRRFGYLTWFEQRIGAT